MPKITTAEELVHSLKTMHNPHLASSDTDGSIQHMDQMLAMKGDKGSEAYKIATEICDQAKADLRGFMRDNRLDAVVGPMRMYSLSGVGALPLVRRPLPVRYSLAASDKLGRRSVRHASHRHVMIAAKLQNVMADIKGNVPTGLQANGDPGHLLLMGNPFAERDVLHMMYVCRSLLELRRQWHVS